LTGVIYNLANFYGITFIFMNITQAHTQIPDDGFICTHCEGIIFQADTVTRGCLSCNRYVGMFNLEISFQFNNAADLEHNHAGDAGFHRLPKTSLDYRFIYAVILSSCNDEYLAGPAPFCEGAKTLRFGEGGCFCLG